MIKIETMLISAIELNEAIKKGDKIHIIDVREPYEYAGGNIQSIHIPMGEIVERIGDIPHEGKIVIMCRSGKRAEAVANLLRADFGKENVFFLEGGIESWKLTVDPTVEVI